MGARHEAEPPATDGHPRQSATGRALAITRRFGVRAAAPLLAGLSLGAALAMEIHAVPLALRIGLAAAVALIVGLTIADLRSRLHGALHGDPDLDPVTGLVNREAFERALERELERAREEDGKVGVIVLDVDGLRTLAERLGGEAADGVLQLVAHDLEKWKRRIDTAARLGDEGFALLLPESDAQGALLVSERLRRASHRTFAELSAPLTLSLGVAAFPAHAADEVTLLEAGQRALLAAKELGRDRSAVFSQEVDRVLGVGLAGGPGPGLRLATAIALAEALDLRDTGATTHSRTVGRCAVLTARELGLAPERCERVRLAGVLHDVGMIAVSAEVAAKPEPLDDAERAELRLHPQAGARLLAGPAFADLREWIAAHHERHDGSGYPRGLRGDEIPVEARIVGLADEWEELTAGRPGRPPVGADVAREKLLAGTAFDPAVAAALLRALAMRAPAG
jgi:diguanylate cyclase (GGDEF)-like protein